MLILANTTENRVCAYCMTISLPYWKVTEPTEVSVSQYGWPRDPRACTFIFQHVQAVWFKERSLQEQTHILHTGPQWRPSRSARGCRYEIEASLCTSSSPIWLLFTLCWKMHWVQFNVIMYLKWCQKCQHKGIVMQKTVTETPLLPLNALSNALILFLVLLWIRHCCEHTHNRQLMQPHFHMHTNTKYFY